MKGLTFEEVGQEEVGVDLPEFSLCVTEVGVLPVKDQELDVLGLPVKGLPKQVDVAQSTTHQNRVGLHLTSPEIKTPSSLSYSLG